jgi:hypothetical protein
LIDCPLPLNIVKVLLSESAGSASVGDLLVELHDLSSAAAASSGALASLPAPPGLGARFDCRCHFAAISAGSSTASRGRRRD